MTRATRFGLCAGLLAFGLAACGEQNGGNWGQVIDMVGGAFEPTPEITLQQAAANPFASMAVRVGDGQQMMVVLAGDPGYDMLWTSKARLALTTRAGRVVRSSGLARNIDGVSFKTTDPVLRVAKNGGTEESERFVDFWDLNRFQVPLHCVAVSKGPEPVTLLGKSIATVRVDETCENAEMDWSFTDSFWVGSSGLVWKSVQHVHPDFDPLELEVLRPPASAF